MSKTDAQKVLEQFDIKFFDKKQLRDGWLFTTENGNIFVKKNTLSERRIMFIHEAKEYLYKNGFTNIDSYIMSKENKPYLKIKDSLWTAAVMPKGRECDFFNSLDVKKASVMLGELHMASRGFVPSENAHERSELGTVIKIYKKRLNELIRFKKYAHERKTRFDTIFMDNVDNIIKFGNEIIRNLKASEYNKLVENEKKRKGLCHCDYTHYNIIIGKNPGVISFDKCCRQLKEYDLANLIRRKMRKSRWQIQEALKMIEDYETVEAINKSELNVLILMTVFPQKFWRISNQYYNSRKSWADKSCTRKLSEVINEEKLVKIFLDKFKKDL